MYSIKINDKVVAVSGSMYTALQSVRGLVAEYAGIRNENAVEFVSDGISYLPWSDSAKATVVHNEEIFVVFISRIKYLD